METPVDTPTPQTIPIISIPISPSVTNPETKLLTLKFRKILIITFYGFIFNFFFFLFLFFSIAVDNTQPESEERKEKKHKKKVLKFFEKRNKFKN